MKNEKKLFFFAHCGPVDGRAWAVLWTEKEFRDWSDTESTLLLAGITGRFKTCKVEHHAGFEEGTRVYSWGETQPGADTDECDHHTGLRIYVDGVVVYSDLQVDEEFRADHDEGAGDEPCEDCVQIKP